MTARRYADRTKVPADRSRSALEQLVRAHGATAYATMWDKDRFAVMFAMRGRQVRIDVPAPEAKRYPTTTSWTREERRRWRVLLLHVKSKLEMVRSGDADFDTEFLGYLVLPGGATVSQRVVPNIDHLDNPDSTALLLGSK